MRIPAVIVSLGVFALLARGGVAAARPAPTGAETALQVTLAKALLEEGRKLVGQGLFEEAREKLEASVQRDPTPEALLELAACQEKLGATASAWGTLHRAEERARTLGDPARARDAQQRAAKIEPGLSYVKLVVGGTPSEIRIDGRPLDREAWGVPLPLDPGRHRVQSGEGVSRTFELLAGERQEVIVPEARPRRTVSEYPSLSSAETPPSEPRRTKRLEIAGLTLGITGVVLSLVAAPIMIGVGVTRNTTAGDDVAIAGAVALGAGLPMWIVGYVLLQRADKAVSLGPRRLVPVPMVARSGGGLSLQGAF